MPKTWEDQFEDAFAATRADDSPHPFFGRDGGFDGWGDESPVSGAARILGESILNNIYRRVEAALHDSGSPIEEAMLMALLVVGLQRGDAVRVGEDLRLGVDDMVDTLQITPQFKVGRFRADFHVEYVSQFAAGEEGTIRSTVLVECDGHDYHERTKDQAKRDKARDRKLQAAGHAVLHFTGSEIWANPLACASDVYDFLSAANCDALHERINSSWAEAAA